MASMAPAGTAPDETPECQKPPPSASTDDIADEEENNLGVDGRSTGEGSDAPTPRRRCKTAGLCLLEGVLLALFVYSTAVQLNDPDVARWWLYYAFQAALPALFVAYFFCCRVRRLGKIIVALAVIMSAWSIVYIVLISLDLQKLLEEEEPDADAKEEYVFELAGVSLGLLSAVYHMIIAVCCFSEEKKAMA